MKIALCHFRVGETDGVSLEMEKWKKALEMDGHKVIYIAGSSGGSEAEIIPGMHYQHPVNNRIVRNAYGNFNEYQSDKELQVEILNLADEIENDLVHIIQKHAIQLLIPNNILSLGWGLSAGIAFTRAIKKTKVKAICHHHDFHWERELYAKPQFDFVKILLNIYFPPIDESISHICINRLAQKELKKRYKINAKVVPNVFEFKGNVILNDDYNRDLRKELGIKENDIVFLQATRIVERKAIELAIDLVNEINFMRKELTNRKLYNGQVFSEDSKVFLVFAGKNESPDYYKTLMKYAIANGVGIIDISKKISHERAIHDGEKQYSLWDAYSIADVVTYPSILEGWGNQLLEALVARLPIIVFKYPVFKSDIEKYKFNVISLGNNFMMENNLVKVDKNILKQAANEAIDYLLDEDFRNKNAEFNYKTASKNLSIENLKEMLHLIISNGKN